jgi:fatty acid/phospholipid biosynthesis enzyme
MADRLIKVVNNTNGELGIQLNNGGYLSMTQFISGKTSHISKPAMYDTLPDSVTKKNGMLARKMVSVIDA